MWTSWSVCQISEWNLYKPFSKDPFRRLDVYSGSSQCKPAYSHLSCISALFATKGSFLVYLSSLWDLNSTTHLHQDASPPSSTPQREGTLVKSLTRRFDSAGIKRSSCPIYIISVRWWTHLRPSQHVHFFSRAEIDTTLYYLNTTKFNLIGRRKKIMFFKFFSVLASRFLPASK